MRNHFVLLVLVIKRLFIRIGYRNIRRYFTRVIDIRNIRLSFKKQLDDILNMLLIVVI